MSAIVQGLVGLLFKSPDWLFLRLSGRKQETLGHRKLLPAMQFVCSLAARQSPAMETLPPEEARKMQENAPFDLDPEPEGVETRELSVPVQGGTIAVRAYAPAGASGALPGLVYFHGGGWVIGSLQSHHGLCARLALLVGCRVFSVDYRLAPEHRFPVAAEDCDAAFSWVLENATDLGVDPARLAAGGDSAGGNLAAVLCLRRKAAAAPLPCVQLLLYPVTDLAFETKSFEECGEGFLLTRGMMEWFREHYAPNEDDWRNPQASPLRAEDLSGHPPAILVTAGFDPLRDEGAAYGENLRAAGVEVESREFPSLIHGFANLSLIPEARAAVEELADLLRARL